MTVAVGCDHGAYDLKEAVKKHLEEQGIEVKDYGTYDKASCDYPVFAQKAAKAVAEGTCERGIVLCTTGIGVSITANKVRGIRCALCTDTTMARLTREHNDANVLALGAGITGQNAAMDIVDTFLHTEFSHGERHMRRISEISELEKSK